MALPSLKDIGIVPTTQPKVGVVEVLKEVPQATKTVFGAIGKFTKEVGQSIARSFIATGVAIAGEGRPSLKNTYIPQTNIERKIFGTDKPIGFKTIGEDTLMIGGEDFKNKWGNYSVPVGMLIAGLDITPFGFGKKGVMEVVTKTIAKTDDVVKIAKVLKTVVKGSEEEINVLAKSLKLVNKEANVLKIIEQAGKAKVAPKIAPQAKIAIKEAIPAEKGIIPKELELLAVEARKYKSAEEFVKKQVSRTFDATDEVTGRELFHATTEKNLKGILENGLQIGKEARFGESKRGGIYLAERIRKAAEFVEEAEKPVYLRIKGGSDTLTETLKGKLGWDRLGGESGSIVTNVNISPQYLEIKTKEGWKPLSQLTDFYTQAVKGVKEVKPEVVKPSIRPPIPPSPPIKELPQMAGKPIEDPIKQLNDLIKQAKPKRGRLEAKYTAERAKRIAEVERVIDEVGGEKGYAIALSKLKGELVPGAKAVFEPIKEKLSKEAVDALYNKTFKHPYLDNWEKINAADGLSKLLVGQLPTPKELVLLEEIYGTDLIKNILAKRALGLKITDVVVELLNVPRAILATADMSAFLRQGVIYVVAHPKIAAKAMGKTFQFAFSPKAFAQYFKDLPKEPLYNLMRKSGLAITDPSRVGMVGREEAFISRLLQKTPILGQVIKFAERSYVGFLNKLRVDVFKTFADEFLSKGFSPVKDADLFKSSAEVVNSFTGRGSLGTLNRITPHLNILFFSPRLIAARFNALNPVWYVQMPPEIRKKAITDFAKFVSTGLTVLALAKLHPEADVEIDPRSSDFGKIRIGNTRWDIWGGFQQWVRVFAQAITGERKNTTTGEIVSLTKDEYPFTTRKEVILRFFEGKLAPVPALVNELISGAKTFQGEDITFETVVREKFIPMYIQDIAETYADGGLGRTVGAGVAAFFGVGVQTYEGPTYTAKGFPSMKIGGVGMPSLKGVGVLK